MLHVLVTQAGHLKETSKQCCKMSETTSKHTSALCTMQSLHLVLLVVLTIFVYYVSKPHVTEVQPMNRFDVTNVSYTVSMAQPTDSIQRTAVSERTYVMVISQKRSGSSFMGELFNQNPTVFFMFEPLRSLTSLAMKKTSFSFETAVHNTLNSIFKCELTHVPVSGWIVKKTEVSTCFNAFEMQIIQYSDKSAQSMI
ncbi:carbohydrate sulfotransferase 1-like isoform X1 [Asterias rubens]|uniref:carbohydrate sulfotransferase 1-like isoform X1 n=1 Tax=Asterias rubens TaxID=7604 RepID=UPI0014557910|nr:carbohydrate sulfotransferase 1-like isoform X1 [Asterias rubens]